VKTGFNGIAGWLFGLFLALWPFLLPPSAFRLGSAEAAEYPTRPIRLICPYPPGGSTDPTARAFAAWLSEAFGQSVVVDNRPGAGSTIGHGIGAKATPDGYTILLGTSGGLVVSPAFGTKIPYDPLRDFAPIGLGVYAPFLLALHPSLPAANLKELIALSKAQPTRINFASPGVGTPNHLGAELLKALSGFQFVHVPYKGGGPAIIDMVAGRAQAIFGGVPYVGPHVKAGRLKVVAIGHPTRIPGWPDTPAIAESVPGFNNTTWYGLLGPAGTPRHVINRINAEMKKAVADPGFVKQLEAMGLLAASSTPAEFGAMIRSELARWTKVIKQAGITADGQ